jgi:hypothetical protein
MLELSLTQNGKLLFRLEIGGLDSRAVLMLTEQAIENAKKTEQRDTSRSDLIPKKTEQQKATQSENHQNAPSIDTLTPNMKAVIAALLANQGKDFSIKELLKDAISRGFQSKGQQQDQAVRYQIRLLTDWGWVKDSAAGTKNLTDMGLTKARELELLA